MSNYTLDEQEQEELDKRLKAYRDFNLLSLNDQLSIRRYILKELHEEHEERASKRLKAELSVDKAYEGNRKL